MTTTSWVSNVLFADPGTYNVAPALDYNTSNGTFVVTWYSFTGANYTNYGKSVTFNGLGQPVFTTDDLLSTTVTGGNVSMLPVSIGDNARHLGEYHEVSYTNGRFKAAHVIAPTSGNSEVWVFTVNP